MNVSTMTDVVEIECTVSTCPGIQCSASEHGVITIQTKTESITIRLQQTINKKRVPISSVEQQPVRTVESSSRSGTSPTIFWFAGNSDQKDTRQDDYSDGGQANTDISNIDGPNDSISGQKKLEEAISDEKLAETCQQLAFRTLKKWKSKQHKVEKNLEALRSDWSGFFGFPSYASLGQWSYNALDTSEKFGDLQRPFHQLNLAYWWNECLERKTSEVTSRVKTLMMSALEPRFEKLGSKEKDAKRKQIERYVLQGEVISLMFTKIPGLVVTVSDLITTSEYHTLWKNRDRSHVLRLDWISKELIQVSELYTESVQSIFRLMQHYFTFSRQPAPSQQVSCTLSLSPTEPESRTNAASFCQRVKASSCKLASSYETSVYSRQPFGGSTEASTNATKRQKTSRHTTSQFRARQHTSQEKTQNNPAFSSHVPFSNTHGEHQDLDVAIAVNVLQSLQHSNQSYTGLAAAGLPTPDTLEFGDALQGASKTSTEDCSVSCEDSAGSVMRSCHLSASGIGRLEPGQQRFPGHLDVLPDRQASDSTLNGLNLVDQVPGVGELESQQLRVVDGLFLSDFMEEYREIM